MIAPPKRSGDFRGNLRIFFCWNFSNLPEVQDGFWGGEIQGFHWKSPDIAAVNPFLRKWGGGKFTRGLRRKWPKRPDFRRFPMKSSDLGGGKTQTGLLKIWESFLRIFLFDTFATRDFPKVLFKFYFLTL